MDPAEFRQRMRRVAGAVALVTVGPPGARTGLTATAIASLSDSPPMLLACVNRLASAHPVIRTGQCFAVNLLARAHRDLALRFAGRGGVEGEDRFALGAWGTLTTGAPVLGDAIASFDCTLLDEHEYETHSIFVGLVQAAGGTDVSEPLVYLDGRFGGVVLE